MLEVGDPAPEFELEGVLDGETATYRLTEFTDDGQWVLVTFYAFDFHPVCTEGTCALRDTEFLQFEPDLTVLGISGDGIYSHVQFAAEHNMNYPLLSDTGKTVGEQFGVVRGEYEGMQRVHQRSVFLIDPDGVIRLAMAIDAESPEEVEVEPLVDSIREIRG